MMDSRVFKKEKVGTSEDGPMLASRKTGWGREGWSVGEPFQSPNEDWAKLFCS